jgi:hypothetical protein
MVACRTAPRHCGSVLFVAITIHAEDVPSEKAPINQPFDPSTAQLLLTPEAIPCAIIAHHPARCELWLFIRTTA